MFKRRDLLKIGAGALLLHPLFRSQRAVAQGAVPKRVIFIFSPNGTIYNAWKPDASFNFGEILSPLTPHKDHVTVIDGIDLKAGGPGDAHAKGIGSLLTNMPLANDTSTGYATGISLDQYLADKLQGQTSFRSVELGVGVKAFGGQPNRTVMSSRGNNQPIFPNNNPQQIFDLLFGNFAGGGGGGGDPQLEAIRAQKASVLDFVGDELQALKTKVGAAEKAKLDEHLTAVRSIEATLQEPLEDPPSDAMCTVPTDPTNYTTAALTASANYAAISRTQIDLLVEAMACDLLRVGTIVYNGGSGLMNFGFVPGISSGESHHGYSHGQGTDPVGNLTKINKWYAGEIAYLAAKLKSKQEGEPGQTMLDNTLILWGNEITYSQTNNHSPDNIPMVLVGNLNGYFKTKQHLKVNTQSHAAVLVDICRAMGQNVDTFGKPTSTGGLPGLKKV